MSLQFVNILGNPVAVTPVAAPKKAAPQQQAYHKGWHVVGYSPDQLQAARRIHELAGNKNPFDESAWVRAHKPLRVRSKPYEVHSAAVACAEMAEKSGWVDVRVVAKAKGGAA